MPTDAENVCFSNLAFEVERFQAVRQCSVDVARGLLLPIGIGTRPFHHGILRRGGTICWAVLPVSGTSGPADLRTHLIHRPARDIIPLLANGRTMDHSKT